MVMAMMPKVVMTFGSDAFYEDLSGRRWPLSSLTPQEQRFLQSFVRRVNERASWPDLSSSWRVKLLKLYDGRSRKDVVRLPLYAVCQDIESRVGIDQGFFRQRDYRDDLAEMISRTRDAIPPASSTRRTQKRTSRLDFGPATPRA